MKNKKVKPSVFNSIFSEVWRKEKANSRFGKDATECKQIIRQYAFWRFYCFLSILANLVILLGGVFLLQATYEHVFVFRLFLALFLILQGMLVWNLFWLTKGEGRISEDRIPGKTALNLAVAWNEFLKEVNKTDLLKDMTSWSRTKGISYFGHNEIRGCFEDILRADANLIEDLEAEGKEEKKELIRSKMSVVYDIGGTLNLNLSPFASYFPSRRAA